MPDRRSTAVAWGTLIFGVALVPRLCNVRGTYRSGEVFFGGFDPWYHMRRIDQVLATGALPAHDAYLNFPTGAPVDWPPGFDLLMAALVRLLSPLLPASVTPGAICAAAVPVIGALTAVATFALAVHLGGRRAGIAAGLIVAAAAANIDYSTVGRVDHNALEPLLLVAVLASAAWAWGAPDRALRQIVLGATLAVVPGFWPGAIVFSLPIAAAGAYAVVGGAGLRPLAIAFGTAAVLGAALALTTPWGRDGRAVYYALSWFQPATFVVCALGIAAAAWLTPWLRAGPPGRWWGGAVAAGAVVAIGLAGTPAGPALGRGFDYLLGFEAQISVVAESRSPLRSGVPFFLRWCTPLVLLAPPALVWSLRREGLRGLPARVAVAFALAEVGLLGLLQVRFVPIAVVPLAVVTGVALDAALGRLHRRPDRAGRMGGGALAGAVLASLLWSMAPFLSWTPDVSPHVIRSMDSLLWLRNVAPPTAGFDEGTPQPEYGVLSSWTLGHHVTYVGRKPNVANPLGQTEPNLAGLRRAAAIQLADDPAEATSRVDASGIRFLLLTPLHDDLESLCRNDGRASTDYLRAPPGGGRQLTPAYFRTFHSRLYLDDGGPVSIEGAPVEPLEGYRLVHESTARAAFLGRPVPHAKIFERVRGAVLQGRCTPGSEVRVSLRVETPGREFPWHRTTIAGPDGAFAVRVPYATDGAGTVAAAGPWTVECDGAESAVGVPEAAVIEGLAVPVPRRSAPPEPPGDAAAPTRD